MAIRQPTWRDVVIPLAVGCFSLGIVAQRASFAGYATVDVLELVAAGVMFGLALRAISMLLHKS